MLRLGLVEPGWTFFIQLLNTFILYLILKKLLFKPVTEFMANREKEIADSIQRAEDMNEEALKLKSEYMEKLKVAEEEGREIIREASKKAEERAAEIIKGAEKEAKEIKERALLDIAREKEKAINDLKDEIASIAMLAASKVIEKNLDDNAHRDFVRSFIDEVGETRWQN